MPNYSKTQLDSGCAYLSKKPSPSSKFPAASKFKVAESPESMEVEMVSHEVNKG